MTPSLPLSGEIGNHHHDSDSGDLDDRDRNAPDFLLQPGPTLRLPDLELDRWCKEVWPLAMEAGHDTTPGPSQAYHHNSPQSPPPPNSEGYDWNVILSMFDLAPPSPAATEAYSQAANDSHEPPLASHFTHYDPSHCPQLGVASSDVHSNLSTVRLNDSLPPSNRYAPYKIPDRLAAHRGNHHLANDGDTDMIGQYASTSQPISIPLAAIPPAPAPVPSSLPTTVPPTTTSSSSLAGRFGLEDLPQVKLDSKERMKRSTFDHSFLLSTAERTEKALDSLATTVAKYNSRKSHENCLNQ